MDYQIDGFVSLEQAKQITSAGKHDLETALKQRSEGGEAMSMAETADAAYYSTVWLQKVCHGLAVKSGWWTNPKTGEAVQDNPLAFSNKLMLIVSEVAEAMEGDRKGLPDDKLPHRSMREVELADALIRIFDLAGAYKLDLAGALVEKLAYNQQRPDHKPEHRAAEGGKTY